jgi:hypothetical protein
VEQDAVAVETVDAERERAEEPKLRLCSSSASASGGIAAVGRRGDARTDEAERSRGGGGGDEGRRRREVAGFNSDGDGPGRVESVSVFYAYALLIPGNMQALFSGGADFVPF